MMNEYQINRFNKHVGTISDWYKPDGVLDVKYKLMYDGDDEYRLNLEFMVYPDNIILFNGKTYIERCENRWFYKIKHALINYLDIFIIDGECNIVSYDGLYGPEHYIH